MTAFNDAFFLLKNEHSFDLTHDSLLLKGKFEEANQLRGMRQFVLENENSADPAMRQAAEDMYQRLTAIMSAQSGTAPMQPPEGPVGEGAAAADMSQPPEPPQHPMMKAWMNLKKNVIGMQDGQQFNMPPPIESMSQRQQIPETMTQTMESQAPGMMGRFKQPVQQTAQIPTGQNILGARPEGAVQENQAQVGSSFEQQSNAPGANVSVAPRPGPFAPTENDPMGHTAYNQPSLSGQGYYTNAQGEDVTDNTYADPNRGNGESAKRFNDPVGTGPGTAPAWMSTNEAPQGSYGDQFQPDRQF